MNILPSIIDLHKGKHESLMAGKQRWNQAETGILDLDYVIAFCSPPAATGIVEVALATNNLLSGQQM